MYVHLFITLLKECKHTIEDLFAKAENPDLIFVGVCNQVDPEDDADCNLTNISRQDQSTLPLLFILLLCILFFFVCLFFISFFLQRIVRVSTIDYKLAKGPCYARSITQSLVWNDPTYYLQIDRYKLNKTKYKMNLKRNDPF